jgi:hypothetical protein
VDGCQVGAAGERTRACASHPNGLPGRLGRGRRLWIRPRVGDWARRTKNARPAGAYLATGACKEGGCRVGEVAR